ncbi:MAG: Gfo/Idh/MocA family oxidoreductase [Opitutales bacterium]
MNEYNNKHIMKPDGVTRRHFVKSAAAASAFAILGSASRGFGGSANNRLRMAIVGVGGRGNGLMNSFAGQSDVEIAWLIDPDRRRLESRSEAVKERNGGLKPKTSTDVRHALEDPEVDAIVVAAPNHWHSMMVIWAAQAGKHCYVEKPASHDVYEGRIAMEAAKKYGVVVQHGTQRRSDSRYADLIKTIHSGKYGKLTVSHAFACKPRNGIGFSEVSAPPDWLDWNMWRGHAAVDQYHGNLVHYDWHWFWATGNGDLNNQGTHQLDVAYWALDPEMHGTFPTKVTGLGKRFAWDDQGETPNTMFAAAEYANGQKVIMNIRNVHHEGYVRQVENRFYFEDGGRIIGNDYISPDGERRSVEITENAEILGGGNIGSFVTACRAGDPGMVNTDMVDGHFSSALGHLMNISYQIGEPQPFNEKAGRFGDDETVAQEFLEFHELMRDGAGIPEDQEEYVVGPWLNVDSASERFVGEHSDRANPLLSNPRRTGFELPSLA